MSECSNCTICRNYPCTCGTAVRTDFNLKPANQHPDFGKVCSHSTLKRKCYICDLEDDVLRYKFLCKELLGALRYDPDRATWAEIDAHYALIERAEKELS